MCLYPKIIKNRKYIANQKNGGNVPAVNDKRVLFVPVGCGKCMECMNQKARAWQVRMLEDIRHNKNGKFITLTFSDESIRELSKLTGVLDGYERDNEIAKIAMRRFLERWRKANKKSVRHWFVTELGHQGTENIHMHGIIWTNLPDTEIVKHWQYGFITIGDGKGKNYVNEATVNYITKYITKIDTDHKEYKPRVLTSAGIGKGYIERGDAELNRYKGKDTQETYRTRTGHKIALPIYLRNKIYTDEEKEKLWIDKLNKQVRWVNGRQIDVSKGDDQYYKVLEEERKRNKRLGYGDNSIDWDRKHYENTRRNMLHNERIKRTEEKRRIEPEKTEIIEIPLGSVENAW